MISQHLASALAALGLGTGPKQPDDKPDPVGATPHRTIVDRVVDSEQHAIRIAKRVRQFLNDGLSCRVPGDIRRAFRMPHQGAAEAARRVRQGKAGTGGPYHLRAGLTAGDVRCGCRECVEWRRGEILS